MREAREREETLQEETSNSPVVMHDLAGFAASCFERATEATAGWADAVSTASVEHQPPPLFRTA